MKYPKEIILKLEGGKELRIGLNDVEYIRGEHKFKATIFISTAFVDAELEKGFKVITEEKEF